MLPNSRPQIGREQVIDALIAQNLWTNRTLTKAVIVTIRGYYLNSMGKTAVNDRGIYDDALILLTPDSITTYNGNTDPSRYRKGIAQLVAPQVIRYAPGYHGYNSKYGHPAFRQHSSVIITRDLDTGHGKRLPDGTFTDKGFDRFWTNLHRGGYSTTSSAGCQTCPPSQWDEFYQQALELMERYNQSTISCYLILNPELVA